MNVNTRGSVKYHKQRGIHRDAVNFEPNAHTTIMRAIRSIQLKKDDTIFVLGCGKGRTVCHFARQNVRKVLGVELDKELSEIARNNAKTLRGRRAEIEILNNDAASVDTRKGTVFFFFNPFGEKTMRAVLNNIEKTHDKVKSSITIIYVNPIHYKIFEEYSWLKLSHNYQKLSGLKVMIFQNR